MIEEQIISFGYLFIFLILYANGIFAVVLNSSQLTFIISGYLISKGHLSFILVFLVGSIARTLGNITTYEIIRKFGLSKRVKRFFHIKENILLKFQNKFREKGILFIFFGKLIPMFVWAVSIICGISKTNRVLFAILMFITNCIWALIFISLGYLFGKDFTFGIYYSIALLGVVIIYIIFLNKYLDIKKEDFK